MTISLATSNNFGVSLRDVWTDLSPRQRRHILTTLSEHELDTFNTWWDGFAHAHQLPPQFAANGHDWATWLLIGGRGAGKTRAGAEWIKAQALGLKPFADRAASHIALIGQSEHDVREVMIEGVAGLLAVHSRGDRPIWTPSRKRLEWQNGAVAYAFSAEDPESLRGPQFEVAWSDELAKWRYAQTAFDMIQFSLRLGERPRQMITTTPRPTPLIRKLLDDPATAVTRAPTRSNAYHLAPTFLSNVLSRYSGTRIGRQELEGELIDDRPDSLWSRATIETCRVNDAPPLKRIVVAVDPPVSSSKHADACGLVAAGRSEDNSIYVIADETLSGMSPAGWATKAIALWRRLRADALVVEINQGGEMVRSVIGQIDNAVPMIAVRATRGKWLRAEPVAALYEQGRVKHIGSFPALEDEMCDFGLNGLSSGRSPDRLDALVWAITSLSFGRGDGPRLREL